MEPKIFVRETLAKLRRDLGLPPKDDPDLALTPFETSLIVDRCQIDAGLAAGKSFVTFVFKSGEARQEWLDAQDQWLTDHALTVELCDDQFSDECHALVWPE